MSDTEATDTEKENEVKIKVTETAMKNLSKNDLELYGRLKETGAPDALILQYQRYLDSDDRQGQERLLYRFRGLQSERLQNDREKLFCLDYIISMVENL